MRRPAIFLVMASVAGAVSTAAPARACSLAGPAPYAVDTSMQATDHVAPTLPPVSVARLQRGAEMTEGCTSASSCDGLASVAIHVAVSDDVTPTTGIGYRFSVLAGALPPSFIILLDEPSQVTLYENQIWFNWWEGTEDHESIDFTLQIVAIDRAGNESPPQMVRVTDDPGGCAIARPRAPYRGLAVAALAALLLAARRPRPRGAR